jgi:hypothetical protein
MKAILFLFSLFLILNGCSTPVPKVDPAPQVRPAVQMKIDQAREALSSGEGKVALSRLAELADEQLEPLEKAVKYNLKGVIHFTDSDWEKSLANFDIARKYVPGSSTLESQIWLNMASARYKQGFYSELKEALESINLKVLPENEIKKYAQLNLAWAIKYQRNYEIVENSVLLLKDAKSLSDVSDSILKERLNLSFKELSDKEKIRLLEKYESEKWLPLAYLGQIEAESRYFKGDTSGARDVVTWLSDRFKNFPQVMTFVNDFEQRLDSSTRLSMDGIGVILPLTGEKGSFGQKTLLGLDIALKGVGRDIEIYTKDSFDSPSVGAQAVRDLIQQNRVPLIIGGLFPESARAEYLEAKKWGVLFISLAPVHIPRDEKNHLLIEIQGSIESQVSALVTNEMLSRFGKRVGVIYPQGDAGKAYADEFWRAALKTNMQITSMAAYPKGTLDFRETIKHFLGLRFPRERSEELEVFRDTYVHERSSIRRIQNLPPSIDFDWVFVASYPNEAKALVPTFGYYDAKNLKVFGGPSWTSRTIVKEQKNLGRLYMVGEDPGNTNLELSKKFQESYGKPPTLLEMLGFDAAVIAGQLMSDAGISQRSVFDARMKDLAKLNGASTQWELSEGLWIKKMQPLVLKDNEVRPIFEDELR